MIKRFFFSPWSIAILFVLALVLALPLVTAQPYLDASFLQIKGLLIRTVIKWTLLIVFPLLTLLFVLQTKTLQSHLVHLILGRLARLALFMGLAWGLIGNYLAHNWSFIFSPIDPDSTADSKAFWMYSITIPVLCLLTLLIAAAVIAIFLVKKVRKK